MGSVVKTIFGGTDKSSLKQQKKANERSRTDILDAVGQARADATSLFPTAAANRNLGFQSALDVFGQTIPGQIDAFQQGNMGAQQAILAGLPQVQNAILGLPVDMSGIQPQRVDVNTGFAQQQLPQFQQPAAAQPQGQQLPGGVSVQQLLAGRGVVMP